MLVLADEFIQLLDGTLTFVRAAEIDGSMFAKAIFISEFFFRILPPVNKEDDNLSLCNKGIYGHLASRLAEARQVQAVDLWPATSFLDQFQETVFVALSLEMWD